MRVLWPPRMVMLATLTVMYISSSSMVFSEAASSSIYLINAEGENGGEGRREEYLKLADFLEENILANSGESDSRTKRSGGKGSGLSSVLGSFVNKKLGFIGSLSSISSSSKGSSSPDVPPPSHDYPTVPYKPFDWQSLKKSILASLIQAVKAITGGVIAINGQLVKVKGHLLAAKGNFLSNKGEKITNFGRDLATNAFGHPPAPSHDIPSGPISAGGFGGAGVHGGSSFLIHPDYANADYAQSDISGAGDHEYYGRGFGAKRAIHPVSIATKQAALPYGFHASLLVKDGEGNQEQQQQPLMKQQLRQLEGSNYDEEGRKFLSAYNYYPYIQMQRK